MTKHTSWAIALTATTFLSAPAIAASLTPTLEENNVFSYSEGSKNDYNFTLQEPDADGNLSTKYYKIDLKPEAFSTSKSISWTAVGEDQKDAADVVAVQLPNNQIEYFKYTYTQPEGRTVYNTRQDALSGDVDADFVGINYNYHGAAIANVNDHVINNITGDFINNSVGKNSAGGAIYNSNRSTINSITGDFIKNSALSSSAAIHNSDNSIIGDIKGNFIGNEALSYGTIFNDSTSSIKNINGNFIANNTGTGGAIWNSGIIDKINGNFIGNSVVQKIDKSQISGGAILVTGSSGNIETISGDFIGNYVQTTSKQAIGGAISGRVNNINGNFIGNYVYSESGVAYAGAISGTVNNIRGDFIGNYAFSEFGTAYAGAIFNPIGPVTGNFLNNYAQSISGRAYAGAIETGTNITFISGSETHFMSGNYAKDNTRGKIYNAFLMLGNTEKITFDTTGGGAWVINDNMENGNYILTGDDTIDASTGTTTQYIAINNDIVNARTVTVNGTTLRFGSYQHEDQTAKNWDGKGAFVASLNADGTANRDAAAVTVLSLNNGVFDIANGYQDVVKLKGYSATDSFMHIDVDPDNMSADMLNVNGNVEGVTKLIVHASSDADIRGKGEILFAESENDTTGNEGSFVVSRVYKSPYLFDVNYTKRAENSNQWGLTMNEEDNPDKYVEPEEPDVPTPPTPELPDIPVKPTPSVDYRKVAPEVIAYQGLPVAALEQTKGMIGNIGRQVQNGRVSCEKCGVKDYYWNGEAYHTLWANAVYQTSENEALVNVDADVWGIEAGGDLQHDLNNKLGLFLSYRKGNYDMNGDGKHHYSTIGSEIDIDSYLAGLYYRYDRNHWWTFATVYGGIQRVDLKTKDGIKSDTDGTEFGGSVELGYDYNLSKTLYLTPSVGAFYTQLNYGDASDSAGKTAEYGLLRQLELEAGVKLTKAFVTDEGYANVYVKPSVVQTITDGDEVRITGLGKVNTLEDQTLGRIELGGRYGFTEQLSAYGWANHTFGDDYKASTFGLGLSYSW